MTITTNTMISSSQNRWDQMQQMITNGVSTATAATAIHPLRQFSRAWILGETISFHPRWVFKALPTNMINIGHQLMIIKSVGVYWSNNYGENGQSITSWDRFKIGCIAGIISTPTATITEGCLVRMQKRGNTHSFYQDIKETFQKGGTKVFFRGFSPMAFRQIGMGMGMFFFPFECKRIFESYFSSQKEDGKDRTSFYQILGGMQASLITQTVECMRTYMQNLPQEYKPTSIKTIAKEVHKGLSLNKMWKPTVARLGTIGIAYGVTSYTQESYRTMCKTFSQKEEK
jgi:hypothetical protein